MHKQTQPSRIVGILGGMGPAATADFYQKLILATPAARDQEHLRVVIWADPTVPNRNEALLEGGENPTPWLERGVQKLIDCGAEILVVPCNTIHAYLPSVVEGKSIEFINIVDTTVETIKLGVQEGNVGLLGADGALASGIYQSALRDAGIEPILPLDKSQKNLMNVIYSVKAGEAGDEERQEIAGILTEMRARGVSTVIAGCTEVSVLLTELDVPMTIIDPSQVLALKTAERARST